MLSSEDLLESTPLDAATAAPGSTDQFLVLGIFELKALFEAVERGQARRGNL